MTYVGRFAPSPTGPLHLGSLATAVASYVHARQAGGRWLLRIDDIDPPREMTGAADAIVGALDSLELHWDGEVLYQSTRLEHYRDVATELLARQQAYFCSCSRKTLREAAEHSAKQDRGPEIGDLGIRYPGHCRQRTSHSSETAIRAYVAEGVVSFDDSLQGAVATDLWALTGDYVIYRKDRLPAYHLAVVVDDSEQGITDVVRGIDLLQATSIHIHLAGVLGIDTRIRYAHIPVLTDAAGHKLSKQQGAEPIDTSEPSRVAGHVLQLLGAEPPADIVGDAPSTLWEWAVENWKLESSLRGRRQIRLPTPAPSRAC